MIILGVEGTAHTLGIGIIEATKKKVKVLSNKKNSFFPEAGMIPRDVGEHHAKVIKKTLIDALEDAKIRMNEIDRIAYSRGPGIAPGLRVVATFSRALSLKYKKEIMGVNHIHAHLAVAKYLLSFTDPVYLYVSGGNSQIITQQEDRYVVLGETEDIAIGNALDKLGRAMGLGFPAGAKIEKLAKEGKYIEMPYSVKGMDFSFSGLLTNAIEKLKKYKREDICFSFQEHAYAMLTEVTERAMAFVGKNEVVVVGGVGMNTRLQEMVRIMAKERGGIYKRLENQYLGDNGVMIAIASLEYLPTSNEIEQKIKPKWRIEEIKVSNKPPI